MVIILVKSRKIYRRYEETLLHLNLSYYPVVELVIVIVEMD